MRSRKKLRLKQKKYALPASRTYKNIHSSFDDVNDNIWDVPFYTRKALNIYMHTYKPTHPHMCIFTYSKLIIDFLAKVLCNPIFI